MCFPLEAAFTASSLWNPLGVQIDTAYEVLQQAMERVQENYAQEFPDKKEVVFLPYKASMWDSLESVWMAAKEDEDYIARVMPIPYFDKGKKYAFQRGSKFEVFS